ncbi:hypothetical protein BH11BAC3_BH11BAC3_21590 [soil metagenome]
MIKKNIVPLLVAAVIGGITLQSCKKDDKPAPVPDKVVKLMHDWKITNITTPKTGQPEVDSSIVKTCSTDDIIKFSQTGFDFQDGATKCDSTVFPYSKGSWSYNLATDSIQLNATTPAKYMSWKVTTLNDSIMQVKYIDSLNPLKKLSKTISFKHS